MHHSEMRKFLYSLFLQKVQICGFGVKKDFFLQFFVAFFPLDSDPWIRIFLRIRIQEAKILRIHWIRILSTETITKPS